jgi:hypothetical protein
MALGTSPPALRGDQPLRRDQPAHLRDEREATARQVVLAAAEDNRHQLYDRLILLGEAVAKATRSRRAPELRSSRPPT